MKPWRAKPISKYRPTAASTSNGSDAWTALPINARFAPVIEAQASISGVGSIPFYGVDFLAAAGQGGENRDSGDTDGIVVSKPLAGRLKLGAGDRLTVELNGHVRRFRIAQVADAPSDFLALDIAPAQQVLDRYGKLDRIDVTVSPGEDFARAERAIRQLLPAAYFIQKPGARSDENQRMLRAFRWNLRVLSYISLVVGAFLIYNTISISVVRRRAEIGVSARSRRRPGIHLCAVPGRGAAAGHRRRGAWRGSGTRACRRYGAVDLRHGQRHFYHQPPRAGGAFLRRGRARNLHRSAGGIRFRLRTRARSDGGASHGGYEPRRSREPCPPALAPRPGMVRHSRGAWLGGVAGSAAREASRWADMRRRSWRSARWRWRRLHSCLP